MHRAARLGLDLLLLGCRVPGRSTGRAHAGQLESGAFHGVIWTEGAPAVEKLSLDWQETSEGSRFRICDWDVCDAQMRELLGLV